MDLFPALPQVLVDDAEGGIRYWPDVVPPAQAEEWFRALRAHAPWRLEQRPMYERVVEVPRLLASLRLDADAQDLVGVFDEIAQGALRCRFRDCRHQGEPGCAVQDSVAPERLRNFHKMQRELQRDTLSALERKAQRQVWKVRHKAARARDRGKREGERE